MGLGPIKSSIQRYPSGVPKKKERLTRALYIIVPGLCPEALTKDRNRENHGKCMQIPSTWAHESMKVNGTQLGPSHSCPPITSQTCQEFFGSVTGAVFWAIAFCFLRCTCFRPDCCETQTLHSERNISLLSCVLLIALFLFFSWSLFLLLF